MVDRGVGLVRIFAGEVFLASRFLEMVDVWSIRVSAVLIPCL